ncbi:MAG: FAD-dependent oxidoreductase [Cyclobacteriaceae bacterium]
MKKVDYIIVGLGLAGACLAHQLIRLKRRIVVYDLPERNRASTIAAGLYNPVTGKGIVKTWLADELFPYLKKFYREVEQDCDEKLLYETPLYTPFLSVEEQNEWMAKSEDPSFADYIVAVYTSSRFDQVNDPLGGLLLSNCGHVDVPKFLNYTRDLLISSNSYRQQEFLDQKMAFDNESIMYKDVQADHIVFCRGIHQLESPLFEGIPLKPLKGEVLNLKVTEPLKCIYNRGIYVIETEAQHCKVGATYELQRLSHDITMKAQTELESKTRSLLKLPFRITHQDWGIRPSTTDRRPLIGVHPDHKNVWIFNGLGTKGVSLAPFFSHQLAKRMEGMGDLDKEANITRVKPLYSKF